MARTAAVSMKAREFLFFAEDPAMGLLPASFPRPERRVMWTILQLHYGNPAVHFELQPQPGRQIIELGLHFEGPVEANDVCAARIADQAPSVRAALGEAWELEEWTARGGAFTAPGVSPASRANWRKKPATNSPTPWSHSTRSSPERRAAGQSNIGTSEIRRTCPASPCCRSTPGTSG